MLIGINTDSSINYDEDIKTYAKLCKNKNSVLLKIELSKDENLGRYEQEDVKYITSDGLEVDEKNIIFYTKILDKIIILNNNTNMKSMYNDLVKYINKKLINDLRSRANYLYLFNDAYIIEAPIRNVMYTQKPAFDHIFLTKFGYDNCALYGHSPSQPNSLEWIGSIPYKVYDSIYAIEVPFHSMYGRKDSLSSPLVYYNKVVDAGKILAYNIENDRIRMIISLSTSLLPYKKSFREIINDIKEVVVDEDDTTSIILLSDDISIKNTIAQIDNIKNIISDLSEMVLQLEFNIKEINSRYESK